MPSQLCPTCSLAILSVASKKRLFFCSLLRIYLSVYLYISFVLTTRCEYQILDYRRGKNDRKVPLLSRSLSGSKLNAGAPEFVPKGLQIAFSTSLPAPRRAQELGLSAPSLVLSPSSVIPVLVTPPSGVIHAVPAVAVAKVEEHVAESRPSVDRVLAKDGTGCSDVTVAVEHSEECDQTQAASTSVSQPVKPIVTEELKDKILKQVCLFRTFELLLSGGSFVK